MFASVRPHSVSTVETGPTAEARREAVWFARYLIAADPSEALITRYARATAELFPETPAAADAAVLAFVHAHPWALGLCDAGTALTQRAPLLRKKLVVMMAILEATPDHVAATSPVDGASLPRLGLALARAGVASVAKVLAGTALVAFVTRRA